MATNRAEHDMEIAVRKASLHRYFTPSAPVQTLELFSGRHREISRVLDAVASRGQHVIIYGERGVGKTSLATLIYDIWKRVEKAVDVYPVHITCDTTDTYQSLWFKITEDLTLAFAKREVPLPLHIQAFKDAMNSLQHGAAVPNSVRRFFELLDTSVIIAIDEFDRLQKDDEQTGMVLFADTIKTLSDHVVPVTIIIVGVADSVDALLQEHRSISRALVQIQMPRMSREELEEIVNKGYDALNLTAGPEIVQRIAALAQGLPHFAHLLALKAAENALNEDREAVNDKDIQAAVRQAVSYAHIDIQNSYGRAVRSSRPSIYPQVLLACALTRVDDLGFFAPVDVQGPLSRITKKQYKSPAFARHLSELCGNRRGNVLQCEGEKHHVRYRFANPLLMPYVVFRGLAEKWITEADVPAMSDPKTMSSGKRRTGQSSA